MIASASGAELGAASSFWRGPAAWARAADINAALLALALPWSTTLAGIFAVTWLLALIPTINIRDFLQSLKRPVCALPIILFALAVVGTLWATDIPWLDRLREISPAAKLLAIPILIYQFEKSGRGLWIAVAFLASCTLVMLASWLMFVDPRFVFYTGKALGVPVKNYIVQSKEFALCAFGAFGAAMYLLDRQQKKLASALMVLGAAFLANMVFVVSSRTVLVCIPVLLVVFAIVYFSRRGVLVLLAGAIVLGALAWTASPYLRMRTTLVGEEYQQYREKNAATSTGMRLEFWRKSIRFIEDAPLVGHGTGSTKTLFVRDAVGKTGVSAEIIENTHNQTLHVAVQWGLIGFVVLYAMWFSHLRMFAGVAGLAAWIGLVAVVENFVSSVFNSHLFDFAEGWMYVLAVGVAGGMISRSRVNDRTAGEAAMDSSLPATPVDAGRAAS